MSHYKVAFSLLIGAEETTPNKYRTSTEQVPNKFGEPSSSVAALIKAIGRQQLKGTEAMAAIGLKHRPTFLANYMSLAV